jgi:hypothetical protein
MMMTRREVLAELNRMGVTRLSLLKSYLRDFEKYIGPYYDIQVLRTKKTNQEVWIADRGLRLGEPFGSERFLNRELKN